MRIARVIEMFYPYMAGPINQAFWISKQLEERNIESPVYTTFLNVDNVPRKEIIDNVSVSRHEIKGKFMKYVYTPDLKNVLKNYDFDLIHAHNYRNYQSQISFKIAKQKGKPFIINTHGSLLSYRTYLKGLYTLPYIGYDLLTRKRIIKKADKVVVSSKIEFSEAKKFGVKEKNIVINPMGINVSNYRKQDRFYEINKKNPLKLLFVGRISRHRKIELIINAIKNIENVHLKIVGGEEKNTDFFKSGYLNELKDYTTSNKLNKKVEFVGPKYGKDLINEYTSSDVFVYPSLVENFGQTILEASAAGLPSIVTPVGVANEIIENNISGYIVDFDNVKIIAERIEDLKSRELREKFSKKVKENTEKNYSWENIITKYINIYKDVLKIT
ncbi:glycosyltransferase family 4 protein [Promethearchaeum syntrophicum]|uniref:Glycosyltransferase family 4 protein n=1 Tax=Promethearchaeum syntrophicum TaxID=2594042 RepID=A0A5B9DBD8_9ARCH|nr:glycosyltransferase family 4 protein [Candidatus Prometheoarchaeum syntrophicum]